VRVKNFHDETVKSAVELMAAAGVSHPKHLHRSFIYRRMSPSQIMTYAEAYPYMLRGALLEAPYPDSYQLDMANSSEETFEPAITYA
ncbi:MAG TPA: FMN-binding glutamate synthase family protein, partial [Bacteroidia bacterium]|nr:FMN-binding glutamate synthase family protein [Bacteroidia bacterium]